MDDFVKALDLLNSPELVCKVSDFMHVYHNYNIHVHVTVIPTCAFCCVCLVEQDMLDEIKPLLLQSKRDTSAIHEVWRSLYNQLLEDSSNDSPSSLYGTPSVQKGRKMKDFHKVK